MLEYSKEFKESINSIIVLRDIIQTFEEELENEIEQSTSKGTL